MTSGTTRAKSIDDLFEGQDGGTEQPQIVRATDLTGVHVLKHEDLFMLSNAHGDCRPDGRGLGLYSGDTRLLSTYDLRLNGQHPLVLRAGPAASYRSAIQMANPDLVSRATDPDGSEIVLRRHSLGVVRERAIADGFAERVTVTNYTTRGERARLTLTLDADYADIFELRGLVRERRGERLANAVVPDVVTFAYRGRDGIERRTHVRVSPQMSVAAVPADITTRGAESGAVTLELEWLIGPNERETLMIEIHGETLGPGEGAGSADGGEGQQYEAEGAATADAGAWLVTGDASAAYRAWRSSSTSIETSHMLAERALERAHADLRLLVNNGPGPGERYVAAGVPWFSCLFGRDSIITSLQLLSVRPEIAQSTLAVLARLQATEADPFRDAEPGKILHELRTGELANTAEIPHTPYYGTVDATPLWLMLLDEYERWTGDLELVERLWPNALAALAWIEGHGDLDGDGFVEYERQSSRGLANQGWKDSADSVRNRDGSLGDGPIALVEVQGYVYAARRGLARLARLRGDEPLAAAQEKAAEALRQRFEDAFWMEDAGIYAMALDGAKHRVTGVGSNTGHALWAGICSPERAARSAQTLTRGSMWSGWGIRTLSSDTIGYNPIGYHLGSVWPHDNAIAAAGFARYGLHEEARKVAGTMLEATAHFREARLPELFCGFDRAASPLPVPYPVACSPQAWAAGSLFHLVAATLGLRPDARARRLELARPALPEWLPGLRLRNLRVGDALVDLSFTGQVGSISVEVLRRTGDLEVVVSL
jgi:glycogen debranching enzyme